MGTRLARGAPLARRGVVAGLQEALLPATVPVLPGVSLAARYLVAAEDQAAGGDWFDAVPLPDGALALVVGDVVGHGVQASTAMGQLRAVLDELLIETGNAREALTRVDRLAARTPAMRTATVCVAVLDPKTGDLHYCTCGHPAPLVVSADGGTRYLEPSGAAPLGTGSPVLVRSGALKAGEVLMLFSDGLVERAGRRLGEGLDALARVVGDAVTQRARREGTPQSVAERLCERSIELLTDEGHDDVTVLAAQLRSRPIAPLYLEMPATPAALDEVRAAVRAWIDHGDPSPHDRSAVDLAVTELVANALEHAYPPGRPGKMRVEAKLEVDGVLRVEVSDDGRWRPPDPTPAASSGRGLWMVGSVLNELRIEHVEPGGGSDGTAASGTTVTVRHRLHRPAVFGVQPARQPNTEPESGFVACYDDGPPRVLRVAGALDNSSTAMLADRLSVASRGGVHPVIVDLTGVRMLASGCVSALFAARDAHATHGHRLLLVAEEDSVPAQVLKLVGLDYSTGGATAHTDE